LIADLLQIKPRHTDIWLSALTHKSWLFFHPEVNIQDNEKLEFLGDAVLELIVSEYLYQNFPKFSEGELTFLRAKLVNRERLGKIGEKLGLDKIILFNKKIENKGRLTILGNSLEAIIGALYLDFGYEKAKEVP
jgi:ribonuclease-3